MALRLRPFQIETVDAVMADLAAGVRRPGVILPTGAGKTVVFSSLAARWQREGGGQVMIVANRDELISQAVDKYRSVVPGARVGVIKAARNETDQPVTVASLQTLARPARRETVKRPSLMICDEAHHFASKTAREVLAWADCPAVGFTATMGRNDAKGLGEVWEKISYTKSLLWMIRRGYLADVEAITIKIPSLNLDGMAKRGGDYTDGAVAQRLSDSLAPSAVAAAYRSHGVHPDGRVRPGVIFTPSVQTAQEFAEAFRAAGFKCEAVWGDMPMTERRARLASFDAGHLDVISSCALLTTGWDSPRAEVAVMARPTTSAVLWQQCVGRVLRPCAGKAKALVLDVTGASGSHELITIAELAMDDPRVRVTEGKTLLKALEEADEREEDEDADPGYEGPVETVEADLFGGSRQVWLQTYAGVWFLPVADRFIAVIPAASGSHDVAWFAAKTRGGGYLAREVPDISWAMAHGESEITEEEEMYVRKAEGGKGWRKRKANPAQLGLARGYGLHHANPGLEALRRGELSDLISIHVASARIDKAVAGRNARQA